MICTGGYNNRALSVHLVTVVVHPVRAPQHPKSKSAAPVQLCFAAFGYNMVKFVCFMLLQVTRDFPPES